MRLWIINEVYNCYNSWSTYCAILGRMWPRNAMLVSSVEDIDFDTHRIRKKFPNHSLFVAIYISNNITSPRCNGSSNNLNLQRSRYVRLKWDIDKHKYEKWSKYRFKKPKCRVWGPLKCPKRAKNEFNHGKN